MSDVPPTTATNGVAGWLSMLSVRRSSETIPHSWVEVMKSFGGLRQHILGRSLARRQPAICECEWGAAAGESDRKYHPLHLRLQNGPRLVERGQSLCAYIHTGYCVRPLLCNKLLTIWAKFQFLA